MADKDKTPVLIDNHLLSPDARAVYMPVTPEQIVVDRAQLMTLIQQKNDLNTLFENSLTLMFEMSDLFGGKFPTGMMQIMTAVPKILKKVKEDKDLLARFGPVIESMQRLAPQFMSQDTANEFAKRFPMNNNNAISNG
jgi:hypothetical protein